MEESVDYYMSLPYTVELEVGKAQKLVRVLVFGCAYWTIADDGCVGYHAAPQTG